MFTTMYCQSTKGLEIVAVDITNSREGTIDIELRNADEVTQLFLSSEQARCLLGGLADVFAKRERENASIELGPIESTFAATPEGEAALSRLVCDHCGERVVMSLFFQSPEWKHANEYELETTWACYPGSLDTTVATVHGSHSPLQTNEQDDDHAAS